MVGEYKNPFEGEFYEIFGKQDENGRKKRLKIYKITYPAYLPFDQEIGWFSRRVVL